MHLESAGSVRSVRTEDSGNSIVVHDTHKDVAHEGLRDAGDGGGEAGIEVSAM